MKNLILKAAFTAACVVVLTGCSVVMSLSGKKTPDLSVVRVGATRGEVELQLGGPVQTRMRFIDDPELRVDKDRIVCIYEYENGNDPSAGRAIMHAVLDGLTRGLWEIVGSPIEYYQGEKKRVAVTYVRGVVADVASAPVPETDVLDELKKFFGLDKKTEGYVVPGMGPRK